MNEHPNLEDYTKARKRDDALVPDKKCQHGNRLRSCGYPECIQIRYRALKKATAEGRR